MKILFRSLAAGFCLCASTLSLAGGTQTGTITNVYIRASDGLIYFYLSGTSANRADCAKATPYWMIKDENSTVGKQQLALLMLARAQGSPISVSGMGTCKRWSDGEDVDWLNLPGN